MESSFIIVPRLSEILFVNGIIFFILFLHGVLAIVVIRASSSKNSGLEFSELVVYGFITSVLINIFLVYCFSLLNIGIGNTLWVLVLVDVFLILYAASSLLRGKAYNRLSWEGLGAWYVWLVIPFVILAMNGGLVDYLADSWWHLSRANKMAIADSIFLERGHFSAMAADNQLAIYPAGWHGIISLMLSSGRIDPSLLWHFLAPWLGVVTILAYFRFSRELLGDAGLAMAF